MSYFQALAAFLAVLLLVVTALWILPTMQREKPKPSGRETYSGWNYHLDASPALHWYTDSAKAAAKKGGKKENYGEPPGLIRAVHQDELGFRGWSDMPGDYEGSSASAVSAYAMRSA